MNRSNNIILRSPEWHEEKKKETYWIFLAGPCQGSPEWQKEIEESFPSLGVTLLNPRRENMGDGPEYYQEQLLWETEHLNAADIIMFWFPQEAYHVEGRDYGQTTRAELSEWIEKSKVCRKPIVIGIDPGIPGARYFKERASEYGIPVFDTLQEVVTVVAKKAESALLYQKTWYTSDTHFGSVRTLKLSKRPFVNVLDMDRTMIRNWNSQVRPQDVVFHLGDFGDPRVLRYLNGDIRLIPGNYEDQPEVLPELEEHGVTILPKHVYGSSKEARFSMAHIPSESKGMSESFSLFGHTHGRQIIKEWKGLDVGQDAHHYRLLSEDDIDFWWRAINQYYDDENFV